MSGQPEAAVGDGWEAACDDLARYARKHLIESFREVPGRGLVVIGADMAETVLETGRDAEMFLAALASAECAVHDGEATP